MQRKRDINKRRIRWLDREIKEDYETIITGCKGGKRVHKEIMAPAWDKELR